jgi:hypothetical protein
VLGGEQRGEVFAALVEQVVDPEEEVLTLRERPAPPLPVRLARNGDRAVDLLRRGEVDLAGLLAGGRVVDRAPPA